MTDVIDAGVLTTASDLVFSGNREGYVFALDAKSGALLWRANVGGQASNSPITFAINGRQTSRLPPAAACSSTHCGGGHCEASDSALRVVCRAAWGRVARCRRVAIASCPARRPLEQLRKMSIEAEVPGLADPFRGITTNGRIEPGLFSIRSSGVSTAPVRTAAEAFLAALSLRSGPRR